ISAGRNVALSLLGSPYVEGLSFTLARALGEMAARLAGRHKLAGLVVTGGDVALAVCRALKATAVSLVTEVAPGIPLGRIRGGPQEGLPLITKAGGFGQEDAIIAAIRCLQGSSLS
ncbi:MAG: nucleotide-binding domain containing protein, partial [Chloroflexota bacterium]|nr:nucleotide-binding domain containing protein [Chloroflexota bacterium]